MARPEILFPLFAPVEDLPGVGPKLGRLLGRIGAERVVDLVLLLPHGVLDRRPLARLADAEPGQVATLSVTVGEHRPGRSPAAPYRVAVSGGGTVLEVVHFRAGRDWMERLYPPGAERVISGRLELYDGRWQMPHPDHVLAPAEAETLPAFEPVYPLTQGLGQKQVARAVGRALERLPDLPEWIAPDLIAARGWPGWAGAVRGLHAPDGTGALAPSAPARARLAYDEVLSHQLALQLVRARMRRGKGRATVGDGALRARAGEAFGHPPTGAQTRTLAEIAADMGSGTRMMRLLQGDVGAGKTWVALMALLIAVEAGGQGALMAPTEILARQHAAALAPLADAAGVRLTLLTARGPRSAP